MPPHHRLPIWSRNSTGIVCERRLSKVIRLHPKQPGSTRRRRNAATVGSPYTSRRRSLGADPPLDKAPIGAFSIRRVASADAVAAEMPWVFLHFFDVEMAETGLRDHDAE